MDAQHSDFWRMHPGLVWSNPDATDSVHIRAALIRPRFRLLLDISVEFGIERLLQEWQVLQTASIPEVDRARPVVERILRHISEGFTSAATRH